MLINILNNLYLIYNYIIDNILRFNNNKNVIIISFYIKRIFNIAYLSPLIISINPKIPEIYPIMHKTEPRII